ncbi:transcription factor HHO2-like [Cannabis sativa]|uniref:transcription factor HHO2-like n=1 Tax=Cannabis sativa TaxID=3483 RepID=UPI0029C9BA15|nr:transcription factor HHO2-like [Cannabis sativa]
MVGSESNQQLELTLSLKPSYVPQTLTSLLSDLAKIDDVEKKISILNDYLKKYEEELSQIKDLRYDVPQCMLLLMDAIEIVKDEITKTTMRKVVYDDQDISVLYDYNHHLDGHKLKRRVSEFLTSKKETYQNDYRNDEIQMKDIIINNTINKNNVPKNKYICNGLSIQKDKSNILTEASSFVPWNPYQDHLFTTHESSNHDKRMVEIDNTRKNINDNDGQDEPMSNIIHKRTVKENDKNNEKRERSNDIDENMSKLRRCGSVIKEMNEMIHGGGVMLQAEQELLLDSNWKGTTITRRTWTPPLHLKFLQALDVLGGHEVATPKQIKEQMKVENLTNDQVKSHLQKYRLHLKSFPPAPVTPPNQIGGDSDYHPELPSPNQINGESDYHPVLPGSDNWFSSSSADANITEGIAGTSGGAASSSATTVENENEGSDVVNEADDSFGGWFAQG